ncbi:hypothetical protein ADL00_18330 [Streptomyces sp. AS58]|uniref:S8 family serine peptidase n=1 Tax=Streptomyces sp. AS58 TaxID=1519489 RepID=UPI0006C449F0|nr:S8 family serine peptidase [Streptomyces sp. AS58]KOV65979.1 hypothetical protein ADL00_18330 [Streptomyces sp. AS58]
MRSTNNRWRRGIRAPHRRTVAIAALTAVLAGMAAPGNAQEPAKDGGTEAVRASVRTVTLITGDHVTVTRYPDGRQVAEVRPAHGQADGGFSTREVDGRVHVTPLRAVPFIASGQLDRALFDVTGLIEQGYDDARAEQLPLLLRYGSDDAAGGAARKAAPAGVEHRRVLDSVDSVALDAAKDRLDDFWAQLSGEAGGKAAARTAKSAPRLAGGVEKIWLDQKVKASLDRSVAQIGAPEVWKTGVTGKGVKVAVLDTGVDAAHPDLADRLGEIRNFSSSDDAGDRVGHGTHVAATIAGSGAAANGTRKGVAPDAELMIGKVLGDNGSGSYSEVLAGMEWAARSGAQVVNMSLGGPASEDDPLVTAVEELTDETGALFVVAAGNEGPFPNSVGSPGTAPSALTVGAVDRDDALAPFSSRGPVGLDETLKPDLTAPGVGIVAARAAGTHMGTPENEYYTAASGTSMATPHVAGAAALLKQRHPDWTPETVKNALVGSAETIAGQGPDEQGGGRLDVAGAVDRSVVATATLNFGAQEPDSTDTTRKVTYTNTSSRPVRLALSLEMRNAQGAPAPADAVTPGSSSVTVAAGETVEVPLRARPADLAPGRYSGHLTATPDDGTAAVHTTVGLTARGTLHTMTLRFVDREGGPAAAQVFEVYGSDRRYDVFGELPPGIGELELTLPEDTYFVKALVPGSDDKGVHATQVLRPELELGADTVVVLDARKGAPVEVRTPKPSEQHGQLDFGAYRAVGDRQISSTTLEYNSVRTLYATPTAPVAKGDFEFYSRWSMGAPRLRARVAAAKAPALNPVLMTGSRLVDGTRELPLAFVEPESLDGKDLRGKAVLMRESGNVYEMVTAVAKTGAAALMIVDASGRPVWSPWDPTGERDPLITMNVRQSEGEALIAWLKKHRGTELELSGTSHSPYLYDLMFTEKKSVPNRLSYTVKASETATVEARYHRPGTTDWTTTQRFSWRPWQETSFSSDYPSYVKLPSTRVETVTADDTLWEERMSHMPPAFGPVQAAPSDHRGMRSGLHRYSPGQRVQDNWYGSVVRPTAPAGDPAFRSVRTGDTFALRLAEISDSEHHGYSGDDPTDQVRTRLYRDGTEIADRRDPSGSFPVEPGGGFYRLLLETSRNSPEWTWSTSTESSWSFRSAAPAAGKEELLPLMLLDYDVPVDLRNEVDGSSSVKLRVTARHQDGWTGARVEGMRVKVSTDDGGRWTSVPVSARGKGAFDVRLDRSLMRHADAVSLRVEAWDGSGNKVEQKVLRAFGVR